MKLPDLKSVKSRLPGRGPKGPGKPKAGPKPPKFAADLYADLRDHRLLPLVALLIVAIAAVPFLLGGDDEEASPSPPPPAASAAEASQAGFTVVPAPDVLRDYRKRLADREPRDPFQTPFANAEASDAGTAAGSVDAAGSESPPSAASSESGTGAAAESGSSESSAGERTTETSTGVVIERELKGYVIDFDAGFVEQRKAGVAENLSAHDDVAPVAQLPNKENPVVAFIGLSSDHEKALFLMTADVTAYYGKGHCAFDKQAC
jgi:hypothetical protein